MNLFWRIAVIMILGAWTIWPAPWGLGMLTFEVSKTNLVLGMSMAILWTVVVATVLPLSLRHYKRGTQIALIAMVAVMHYQAYAMGFFSLVNYTPWVISLAMSGIFIFVAWPMIANRLWQWMHYQRAVDPGLPQGDSSGHSH